MIRLVICDGNGTLELPNPSSPIQELLEEMGNLGIGLAVASNAPNIGVVERKFTESGLEAPDIIVTRSETDKPKPSPEFVYKILEEAGLDINEVVYLGDDDNTDIFCAINAHVLPFSADYSEADKPREHGLSVPTPKHFQDYLTTYGAQEEPYFGWTFDSECLDTKKDVKVRVLFGDHEGHTDDLKTTLKERHDIKIGKYKNSLRSILFYYLISQTYLSGTIRDIDYWTVYPGHEAESNNELLDDFCTTAAKVFRDRFLPDLFIRHSTAPELKRVERLDREIESQLSTIVVNSKYRDRIVGKNILALDDFTTSGCSLEAARRMLVKAGAEEIICVAFGKYASRHIRSRIGRDWNPYEPTNFSPGEVEIVRSYGQFNKSADDYFWDTILETFSK